jgi:hypothetical protein
VTARAGIRNTVSTVTGIGINPALAAPTVSSGATVDSWRNNSFKCSSNFRKRDNTNILQGLAKLPL